MAGYENIKDANNNRTPSERREFAKRAGKASGSSRRKKANLRKMMNSLLVEGKVRVNGEELSYEEALCLSMLQEAIKNGNVGAYRAIMETIGQTNKSDADVREQNARIKQMQANTEKLRKDLQEDDKVTAPVQIIDDIPESSAEANTETAMFDALHSLEREVIDDE